MTFFGKKNKDPEYGRERGLRRVRGVNKKSTGKRDKCKGFLSSQIANSWAHSAFANPQIY
jgi:hypothetical protein